MNHSITLISSYYEPEISPATNRINPLISELLRKGFYVNVISLAEKNTVKSRILKKGRLTIYYFESGKYKGTSFVLRALFEIYQSFFLIVRARTLKTDLYVITMPSIFLIPFASYLLSGMKLLDIRDLVWEYLGDGRVKSIISKVMYSCMLKFDKLVVTNLSEQTIINNQIGVNVDIMSNGISQERFSALSRIGYIKKVKPVITYVGNLGIAQNLLVLIRAVDILNRKLGINIDLKLVGHGKHDFLLKKFVKDNNIKNINFVGLVEWSELSNIYEDTSLLYAQISEEYSSAMPSKLYEYAATGLPILYGGCGQATTFINLLENASVIPPDSVDALVSFLYLYNWEDLTVSNYNKKFIEENFIREKIYQNYVGLIEGLVAGKNNSK
jgi:glycosyltransferase involved in cell wall biosynthesis